MADKTAISLFTWTYVAANTAPIQDRWDKVGPLQIGGAFVVHGPYSTPVRTGVSVYLLY